MDNFWSHKLPKWPAPISGAINCQNGAVYGAINRQNGRQILYGKSRSSRICLTFSGGNKIGSLGARDLIFNSEKLLGVMINNTITWKTHLYGDLENKGLLPTLSKRVGILTKLRKHMNSSKFKQVSAGLFLSKLSYGDNRLETV